MTDAAGTVIVGMMPRTYKPGMFNDLTAVAFTRVRDPITGLTTIRFDGVLPDSVRDAVTARMASRNDPDQVLRARLRELLQAGAFDLGDVLTRYVLGDPVIDPHPENRTAHDAQTQAAAQHTSNVDTALATVTALAGALSGAVSGLSASLTQTAGNLASVAATQSGIASVVASLLARVDRATLTVDERATVAAQAAAGRAWVTAHPADASANGVLVTIGSLLTLNLLGSKQNVIAQQVVWLTQRLVELEDRDLAHDPKEA